MNDLSSLAIQVITLVGVVSAVILSLGNSLRIHDLHLSLNSRLDQLVQSTDMAARAEGREEERKDEQARKDAVSGRK